MPAPRPVDPPAPGAHDAAVRFRRFAWGILLYTVAVMMWGAFVRATGSGAGCGAHWPTCHGEVIPRAPAVETLVELTHRVTSGLAWVGALALAWWARRVFAAGHGARWASGWAFVLMTLEALIGAGLVLLELVADNESVARAGWMSAHLLNTFLLLAALTWTVWHASGGGRVRLRASGATGVLLTAALAGVLVVGMSGAVTALGDTLFPVADGEGGQAFAQSLSPGAHLFVRLRVFHPLIGLAVGALVLFAAGAAAARSDAQVRRAAAVVVGLFLGQVGLGFLNVALRAPVWMQLVHLLVADVLWISLVWLTALALRSEPVERPEAGALQVQAR